MSATVKTKSNFSLSTVTTLFEKSFIVLGSPNSYRKAVLLINRWFKTNHSIVLVSSSLRPSLGQTTEAINAPFSEWSPFLPFAISCKSIATNKHLQELICEIISLARGAKDLKFPFLRE